MKIIKKINSNNILRFFIIILLIVNSILLIISTARNQRLEEEVTRLRTPNCLNYEDFMDNGVFILDDFCEQNGISYKIGEQYTDLFVLSEDDYHSVKVEFHFNRGLTDRYTAQKYSVFEKFSSDESWRFSHYLETSPGYVTIDMRAGDRDYQISCASLASFCNIFNN